MSNLHRRNKILSEGSSIGAAAQNAYKVAAAGLPSEGSIGVAAQGLDSIRNVLAGVLA